MFKFDLGQEVWYMDDDRIKRSIIHARALVEINDASQYRDIYGLNSFSKDFGSRNRIVYALDNTHLWEQDVFGTRQELINRLIEVSEKVK